jgi:LacI family transcriptional regulator
MVQTLIDELLAAQPRPTAIFAAADSVAVLVYRALAVRELRVGRDMSVISGNNDAPLIAGLHPHLTTFDVHAHEMGRLAVRQLAMRMSYPGQLPASELICDPTLVEGESVARLG